MASETILNGRYQLTAQQGSGGMSVVYKALDRALGRNVAIKILRPSLTSDGQFLEKFRNEARAVANLSHPNIVTVHDVGSDPPTHYIVMELVEGTDLKTIVKAQSGALPLDRALHLVIQMCAGIGYAHRSGLVHADVKPQNILVTPEDIVKVTDFGIAQALSDTQPAQRAEVVWGSPHYFAPEQAKGEQPTPAADVYAIGIVLFELLTGTLPYSGTNQQELALAHIRSEIPNVTAINPSVPESLAGIVMKAMSKEPTGRYRTADQLGNVLQKYRDRARNNTMTNTNVPTQQGRDPSPYNTVPNNPPSNRPPGVGIPPATTQPSNNADITARADNAPHAPRPYDPRRPYQAQQQAQQANQPSRPISQPPQPFEQRYTPPPPQQGTQQIQLQQYTPPAQPAGAGESGYYRAAYSQQMQAQRVQPEPTNEGTDWVTIILAVIAVIAISGLIPLWLFVLASR